VGQAPSTERSRLGRTVRAVRRQQGLTQHDVAVRAYVSQQTVSRLERGYVDGMRLRVLRSVVESLGADLAVELRTADQPALRDSKQAALQTWMASQLRAWGWDVAAEVSFNHYGDRGRIDVAAFHRLHRLLVVVEVKSRIDDVQDVLGRLDVKTRLGGTIARERRWEPSRWLPALIVADGRTARRRIADHATLFERFAVRSRAALRWLRHPVDPLPSGLLLFVTLPITRAESRSRSEQP